MPPPPRHHAQIREGRCEMQPGNSRGALPVCCSMGSALLMPSRDAAGSKAKRYEQSWERHLWSFIHAAPVPAKQHLVSQPELIIASEAVQRWLPEVLATWRLRLQGGLRCVGGGFRSRRRCRACIAVEAAVALRTQKDAAMVAAAAAAAAEGAARAGASAEAAAQALEDSPRIVRQVLCRLQVRRRPATRTRRGRPPGTRGARGARGAWPLDAAAKRRVERQVGARCCCQRWDGSALSPDAQ